MTDGENIVQKRQKEFGQGNGDAGPLWPTQGLIFKLQVKTQTGLDSVILTWQEALICFNEPWSQGDRIHVLVFGSNMTGVLVCRNEPGSQGKRLHLPSLGPRMTRVLICFNEPRRQHILVRISTLEELWYHLMNL